MEIDTGLTPRKVETREKRGEHAYLFSWNEIEGNFSESVASISRNLAIGEAVGEESLKEDLYRSCLVFLESALDFFCHSLMKAGFDEMLHRERTGSEQFSHFAIEMGVILKAKERPEEEAALFDDCFDEEISRETHMDYEGFKESVNFVHQGSAETIAKAVFPKEKEPMKALRNSLNQLYHRRNEIAHQDDRSRQSGEKNPVTEEEVKNGLSFIQKVVDSTIGELERGAMRPL